MYDVAFWLDLPTGSHENTKNTFQIIQCLACLVKNVTLSNSYTHTYIIVLIFIVVLHSHQIRLISTGVWMRSREKPSTAATQNLTTNKNKQFVQKVKILPFSIWKHNKKEKFLYYFIEKEYFFLFFSKFIFFFQWNRPYIHQSLFTWIQNLKQF